MRINRIFKTIQGESTYTGFPCVILRVSGCNLNCKYCDTKYALKAGKNLTISEIIKTIKSFNTKLVEITGGEPLLQPEIYTLTKRLLNDGFKVLIETNGSIDISRLDKRIIKIIDIKCPDSGEVDRNYYANLKKLSPADEIKFVISSIKDYEFAKSVIKKYKLTKNIIHFSPVENRITLRKIASLIIKDNLNVRLNIQLHKYIWGKTTQK